MPKLAKKQKHSRKSQHDFSPAERKKVSLEQQLREADEDDGSGGGAGKKKLHSYKLEGLLEVLGKEFKGKARNFWRFLASEGLDGHEIEKTDLEKFAEEHAEKAEKSDSATEADTAEKDVELTHAQEEDASLEQAPVAEESTAQSDLVTDSTAPVVGEQLAGRTTGEAFFGKPADHQGAVQQSWMGQDAMAQSLDGVSGKAMQGSVTNANYHANAQGFTKQGNHAGAIFNALSQNAMKVFSQAVGTNATQATAQTSTQKANTANAKAPQSPPQATNADVKPTAPTMTSKR